ncbi:MAG: hypothetical protein GX589_03195 [Deltaproteobacteria bacterium]|nr:hypothetical protein [Deltaproteobacteria bacterium]
MPKFVSSQTFDSTSTLDTATLSLVDKQLGPAQLLDVQVREDGVGVIGVKPEALRDAESFSRLLSTLHDVPSASPLVLDLTRIQPKDSIEFKEDLSNELAIRNRDQNGNFAVILQEEHPLRSHLQQLGLLKQDFLRVRTSLSDALQALSLTEIPYSFELREELLGELLKKDDARETRRQDVTNQVVLSESYISTSVEEELGKVTLTPVATHLSTEESGWKKFAADLRNAAHAEEPLQVIIDLQNCESIGSDAISYILKRGMDLRVKGGELVLKDPPEEAKERLLRFKVDQVVTIGIR